MDSETHVDEIEWPNQREISHESARNNPMETVNRMNEYLFTWLALFLPMNQPFAEVVPGFVEPELHS